MERRVRYWRRRLEAENDPELKKGLKNQLDKARKTLNDFVDEHKDVLRRDPWREKTYNMPEGTRKRNPNENQFIRYRARLGDDAPQSIEEFEKIKYGNREDWIKLQTEYRYKGVIDRLLEKNPKLKVFSKVSEIPDEYNEAVMLLNYNQRDGIYHYTNHDEGVRMNIYLGGNSDIMLSEEERERVANVQDALNNCSLPYDTVLWRGADSKYLVGFDKLPKRLSEWKNKTLSYKGFSSTSIIRDASYINLSDKDTQLIVIKKANQSGAAYVENISYNYLNNLKSEQEVLLQNDAKFSIIEAQKFRGKTIIVVEVL